MIFFFETRTITGVYLTWSTCYWNVLVLANSIMFLIKTITKVTNVIGYISRPILALIGQCTRHTCNRTA